MTNIAQNLHRGSRPWWSAPVLSVGWPWPIPTAFYPDHLKNPNVSLPSPDVGSGIPAPYRIGDLADEPSVSVPSPGVGSGIPAPYRIGN